MDVPETRYAKSGNVHIAYCIRGDGPVDLVYIPGWVSNVELMWEAAGCGHGSTGWRRCRA